MAFVAFVNLIAVCVVAYAFIAERRFRKEVAVAREEVEKLDARIATIQALSALEARRIGR
ncbi:hypothetical protein [Actinomadura coerulea]|uniref:hypothetical protein n=1 Tax=Actinomadura coerulea TaxID=46159 RepID=UPI00344436C5